MNAENKGTIAFLEGKSSEENVCEVLAGMVGWIEAVRPTLPNGDEDKVGIDAVVSLKTEATIANIGEVYVQVKSSERSIERFKRRLRERLGLPDNGLETCLHLNRFIILNGQDSPQGITRNFRSQLRKIDSFWLKRSKTTFQPPRV